MCIWFCIFRCVVVVVWYGSIHTILHSTSFRFLNLLDAQFLAIPRSSSYLSSVWWFCHRQMWMGVCAPTQRTHSRIRLILYFTASGNMPTIVASLPPLLPLPPTTTTSKIDWESNDSCIVLHQLFPVSFLIVFLCFMTLPVAAGFVVFVRCRYGRSLLACLLAFFPRHFWYSSRKFMCAYLMSKTFVSYFVFCFVLIFFLISRNHFLTFCVRRYTHIRTFVDRLVSADRGIKSTTTIQNSTQIKYTNKRTFKFSRLLFFSSSPSLFSGIFCKKRM